ncbi:MAG TPA: hypothetical protein VG103_01085 [Chthoniobacterales bacterium]|nr:hypothetical protein [Chthoniobacterales bacterium]
MTQVVMHHPEIGDRAPPIGRSLRLALGLILIVILVLAGRHVDARFLLRTALLVAALTAAYSLIHLLGSRWCAGLKKWAGAALATGLLVTVYLIGGPGGLLFGKGEGEFAAGTFLGISLLFAAIRGDGGCELMSIPAALFGKGSNLACIVFSPIDSLERRVRRPRKP